MQTQIQLAQSILVLFQKIMRQKQTEAKHYLYTSDDSYSQKIRRHKTNVHKKLMQILHGIINIT